MEPTMRSEGLALPILVALTLAVTLVADGAKANAQQVMFLVGAAEADPARKALTEVGRRRVKALAHQLMDAGIDVIYTFDGLALQRTAEPIAKALNIKSNILAHRLEVRNDLVRRLPTEHMDQRVFIGVGTGSLRHILKAFGLSQYNWKVRTDALLVIVPRGREEPLGIRMRW